MAAEKNVVESVARSEDETELQQVVRISYPVRNFRFSLAIASICLVCLVSTIDLVILASALPVISSDMGASSTQAYWCGTGLLLAQAISQPVYCALHNILGHKGSMLGAISIFGLASVLCATAQNIQWLLAARVLQGVGIGGCNAMVNVLIADLTPINVRGIFLGITQLTAAVGLVAGIVMGAAFSALSTWRLVFWINIPVCVIAGAGILICIESPTPSERVQCLGGNLRQLDVAGVIILSGSLLALLYGITAGGVLHSWNSGNIIAPIVIGTLGLGAFTIYELRVAKKPMIDVRLFRNRTVASGFFSAWAHGAIDIALAYYLILFFLLGRLHPLLRSSLEITPGLATIPFWAAISGITMSRTRRFRDFNIAAWVFLSAGVGALATLNPNSHLGAAYGFELLLAIGSGALYPGRILAVQAPLQARHHIGNPNQQNDEISVATTLVSVFTSMGNAFGVGLGGTIIQNQWQRLVLSLPAAYRIPSSSLEHSTEIMISGQWPTDIVVSYQDILCSCLRVLWIFAAVLGGVGFVVTLAQEDIRLADEEEYD